MRPSDVEGSPDGLAGYFDGGAPRFEVIGIILLSQYPPTPVGLFNRLRQTSKIKVTLAQRNFLPAPVIPQMDTHDPPSVLAEEGGNVDAGLKGMSGIQKKAHQGGIGFADQCLDFKAMGDALGNFIVVGKLQTFVPRVSRGIHKRPSLPLQGGFIQPPLGRDRSAAQDEAISTHPGASLRNALVKTHRRNGCLGVIGGQKDVNANKAQAEALNLPARGGVSKLLLNVRETSLESLKLEGLDLLEDAQEGREIMGINLPRIGLATWKYLPLASREETGTPNQEGETA